MSTFSTNNSEIAKTALNQNLSTEIESATKNEPNRMVSKKSKKKKRSKHHFFCFARAKAQAEPRAKAQPNFLPQGNYLLNSYFLI